MYPEMELLDNMLGTSILLYIMAVPIYITTNNAQVPFLQHPRQRWLSRLLDAHHLK